MEVELSPESQAEIEEVAEEVAEETAAEVAEEVAEDAIEEVAEEAEETAEETEQATWQQENLSSLARLEVTSQNLVVLVSGLLPTQQLHQQTLERFLPLLETLTNQQAVILEALAVLDSRTLNLVPPPEKVAESVSVEDPQEVAIEPTPEATPAVIERQRKRRAL